MNKWTVLLNVVGCVVFIWFYREMYEKDLNTTAVRTYLYSTVKDKLTGNLTRLSDSIQSTFSFVGPNVTKVTAIPDKMQNFTELSTYNLMSSKSTTTDKPLTFNLETVRANSSSFRYTSSPKPGNGHLIKLWNSVHLPTSLIMMITSYSPTSRIEIFNLHCLCAVKVLLQMIWQTEHCASFHTARTKQTTQ